MGDSLSLSSSSHPPIRGMVNPKIIFMIKVERRAYLVGYSRVCFIRDLLGGHIVKNEIMKGP
jgi:hypothetical protein